MISTTIKMKSGYISTNKIKKIYLGNSLVYQDSNKRELTLLSFGTGIVDIRYVAPVFINITDTNTLSLSKFGNGTVDITYIAPVNVNITDSNTLSLQKFGTGIVNIS